MLKEFFINFNCMYASLIELDWVLFWKAKLTHTHQFTFFL